jgi:hypothetical protein
MEAVIDIRNKANTLIESSPKEAFKLYKEIWDSYNLEFSQWDAFNAIKAAKIGQIRDYHYLLSAASKFKDIPSVSGNYGWYIYNIHIKGKNDYTIKSSEQAIASIFDVITQQNQKTPSDYPCPYTLSALKLIKVFSKPNFNAEKVYFYLSKLKPEYLSIEPIKYQSSDGEDIVNASDLETYYLKRSKALYELGNFEECIKNNLDAEDNIEHFTGENIIWLRKTTANCNKALKKYDTSQIQFVELIKNRSARNKWFIYADIADLMYKMGKYEEGWDYSLKASLMEKSPDFLINNIEIQVRLLTKLKRTNEAREHAHLIGSILNENNWSEKSYKKMLDHFGINLPDTEPKSVIHQRLLDFWRKENFRNREVLTGIVKTIHKKGKSGHILCDNGESYFFSRASLNEKNKDLNSIRHLRIKFHEGPSSDKGKTAENIEVIEKKVIPDIQGITIGKTYKGEINGIVDFGLFVKFKGDNDHTMTGLIHIGELPESFKTIYDRGMELEVRAKEIRKGNKISLTLGN